MRRLTSDAYNIGLPAAVCTMGGTVGVAPADPPALHAKEIEGLLAEKVGWRTATEIPIKVTGPLGSNGFSRVFRGDGAMFPTPVAIKQFLWDPTGASPAESARAYFRGLQKIAEVAGQQDLQAAEPYALLEADGVVVASWVEGPTLERSLFRESAARTRKLVRDAGIWLARLHYACGVERRPPDVAGMLARLEAELAERTDDTGSLTRRAVSLLRASGSLLAAQPVPWSCHYGDFKPANLIVRDCQLVAIDLELLHAAPTVSDAAHFLNHLQLEFYSPRAVPRWREAATLAELFRLGYSDAANEPLPQPLLLWHRLYNAVYFMAQYREWSRPLMAWPVLWTMKHLVQTLCDALAG
jgi:aminoglycoside phosphotransferase (APT) family kinase protein